MVCNLPYSTLVVILHCKVCLNVMVKLSKKQFNQSIKMPNQYLHNLIDLSSPLNNVCTDVARASADYCASTDYFFF